MLKHLMRDVPLNKRIPSRYVPSSNLEILQQLNHGSLWVELQDGSNVILFGATLNAWTGDSKESLFIKRDGVELEIPASTIMTGFYEQRDLPAQFRNIWDEVKAERIAKRNQTR